MGAAWEGSVGMSVPIVICRPPINRTSNGGMLRDQPVAILQASQAVDRCQIREGGCFQNIGADAAAANLAPAVLQLDLDFAQSFLSFRDRADAVVGETDRDAGESLD